MKRHLVGLAIAAGMCSLTSSAATSPLNIDYSKTTVSGLSSGGYMATQFHLSHAEWVQGVGVIAAGPYYCAQNGLLTALGSCVNKQSPAADLATLSAYVEAQQAAGKLASDAMLKGDKAWILHGNKDLKVIEPITNDLVTQYQGWLGQDGVKYISDKPFSHHFPTLENGTACDTSSAPFIGNCGYDAAGEMLNYLLGELNTAATSSADNLHIISQQDYASDAAMGDEAFVYVPDACENGETCTLHISFHGCNQFRGAEGVDDHYARMTGLNRWAESNKLVVLYPQTEASTMMPMNPQGCWDWWGYTNEDYANKQGPQIQAVNAIAKALNGRVFP